MYINSQDKDFLMHLTKKSDANYIYNSTNDLSDNITYSKRLKGFYCINNEGATVFIVEKCDDNDNKQMNDIISTHSLIDNKDVTSKYDIQVMLSPSDDNEYKFNFCEVHKMQGMEHFFSLMYPCKIKLSLNRLKEFKKELLAKKKMKIERVIIDSELNIYDFEVKKEELKKDSSNILFYGCYKTNLLIKVISQYIPLMDDKEAIEFEFAIDKPLVITYIKYDVDIEKQASNVTFYRALLCPIYFNYKEYLK